MRKSVIFTVILSVSVFTLMAQEQKEQKAPDQQTIVNKKYDDQGNLVEYDSTFISSWSADTTFHFGFPDNDPQFQFPGIEQFMNQFWNDSLFGDFSMPRQPFSFGFHFSPFDDDAFNGFQRYALPDSVFSNNFPFQIDSLFFNFRFNTPDGTNNLPQHHFFDDFEEQMKQHFFRFRDDSYSFPGFQNQEHRQEWEQLMEKHRQELENLRKKWQDNGPGDKDQ